MPKSFGLGELDSLAICKTRWGIFLTNEKKVINYCRQGKITYFDLSDIITALWKYNILRKDGVIELIKEIEDKDNVYLPNKERLFEE